MATLNKSSEKSEEREDITRLGGALHGQCLRKTKEVGSEQSWVWLQNGDLKRETEILKVVAQSQSIRTNLVKTRIGKSQENTLYRLFKKADQRIDHVASGCSKRAQK